MKYDAVSFSWAGDKYLGRSYKEMDCQRFVEKCMSDVGLHEDLAGSNAWYRKVMKNGWVGSPEDCKKQFGEIPKGALLFIHAYDGGEEKRGYHDGLGNASHIGIKTGRNDGAIHSSETRGCVATSKFQDKTIPNGGWNRIGLYNKFTYGKTIDWILDHGGQTPDPGGGGEEEKTMQGTVWAENGKPVNLRRKPSTSAALVDQITVGAEVTVLEYGDEWCKIETCGKTGYMMTKFIKLDEDQGGGGDDDPPFDPDPEGEYVQVKRETLQMIYDKIGDLLGLRG